MNTADTANTCNCIYCLTLRYMHALEAGKLGALVHSLTPEQYSALMKRLDEASDEQLRNWKRLALNQVPKSQVTRDIGPPIQTRAVFNAPYGSSSLEAAAPAPQCTPWYNANNTKPFYSGPYEVGNLGLGRLYAYYLSPWNVWFAPAFTPRNAHINADKNIGSGYRPHHFRGLAQNPNATQQSYKAPRAWADTSKSLGTSVPALITDAERVEAMASCGFWEEEQGTGKRRWTLLGNRCFTGASIRDVVDQKIRAARG